MGDGRWGGPDTGGESAEYTETVGEGAYRKKRERRRARCLFGSRSPDEYQRRRLLRPSKHTHTQAKYHQPHRSGGGVQTCIWDAGSGKQKRKLVGRSRRVGSSRRTHDHRGPQESRGESSVDKGTLSQATKDETTDSIPPRGAPSPWPLHTHPHPSQLPPAA